MASIKKPFLPREGLFTADAVVVVLKNTLFNPSITLPAFLLLQLSSHGRSLVSRKIFPWLAGVVGCGVVGRINGFLSRQAANNWLHDTFEPSQEIVVVTGGSQGIGAELVKLLTAAGRDLKAVVVVDVQPLQYTAGTPPTGRRPSRANRPQLQMCISTKRIFRPPPTSRQCVPASRPKSETRRC
jgi:hypothetical protein